MTVEGVWKEGRWQVRELFFFFFFLFFFLFCEAAQSCPTDLRGLQPTRLFHPWDFPGKGTGVGCHFLLQRTVLLLVRSAQLKKLQVPLRRILLLIYFCRSFLPVTQLYSESPRFKRQVYFLYPSILGNRLSTTVLCKSGGWKMLLQV